MRMGSIGLELFAFMFSVFVCEAKSYNDALGKPKGAAYRGGVNIAVPNHPGLGQCNVDNAFFQKLIGKARTMQRSVQQTAYKAAWSGTQKDLNDVVVKAKEQYGFEDLTHLGRNATMAVPASLTGMVFEMYNGNPNGWKVEGLAYFHQPGTTTIFGPNIKFTNSAGDEVVYNRDTKRIVPNQYMGTKNFAQDYLDNKIDHSLVDVVPHFEDSNYKYVGILYERDVQDPDKFYIIDGQTGLPMTPRQVAEFPTTLSDMWKDMGLSCAKSDSENVKLKNAPLKAIADGMSQGWEMGGPIGAIGGAVGGGVAAGHIASIENKRMEKLGGEVLQKKLIDHLVHPPFVNAMQEEVAEKKKSGVPAQKGVVSPSEDKGETLPDTRKGNNECAVGVRGWCTCPNRSAHITLGNLFRMGDDFKVADYSYFFCSDCYKVRKDLNGVARLTGSSPITVWDASLARKNGYWGKGEPSPETLELLKKSQEKLFKIADGQIVVPGLCKCAVPSPWVFGQSPNRFKICQNCGRPLSAIPVGAKNTRVPNKLRRCVKTPEGPFVCTCQGETGLRPSFDTSIYDDGEAQLSLMCTKCMQVKYSAFAPMRDFKRKFANAKPDVKALVAYLTGTSDLKAAMAEADAEAAALQTKK